jgi:hypothetical protein
MCPHNDVWLPLWRSQVDVGLAGVTASAAARRDLDTPGAQLLTDMPLLQASSPAARRPHLS